MIKIDKIKLSNELLLPIMNESNCLTKDCVYVIYCLLCQKVYTGETRQTIKDRIYQHLRTVIKFHKFFNNTEIGDHFNRKGHNYENHLRVFVFKNSLINEDERRDFKQHIIGIYKFCGTIPINRKIYKTKKLFTTL